MVGGAVASDADMDYLVCRNLPDGNVEGKPSFSSCHTDGVAALPANFEPPDMAALPAPGIRRIGV